MAELAVETVCGAAGIRLRVAEPIPTTRDTMTAFGDEYYSAVMFQRPVISNVRIMIERALGFAERTGRLLRKALT